MLHHIQKKFIAYHHAATCSMSEEQQAAKYVSSLKYLIQKREILHDVFSVNKAYNKASKIEILESRALPFRRSIPIEKSASGVGVSRVLQRLTDRQPDSRPTPLQQHLVQQPPQMQRAKRISTPSLRLTSVIGVESLDTSPMNAQKESESI